uniref:Ras-related protein Rab-1B n=1 Tax=Hirondellea gigas TaxID=1518452 RepID=A0A6A7G3E1_9CRUS
MAPVKQYDHLVKVLLIGDSGTGKSCLLQRYTQDIFSLGCVSTIGIDFAIKTIQYDDQIVKLQIWDTAGQERFRTITSAYYRGAAAVMVVFDLTNRDSFTAVSRWVSELSKYTPEGCQTAIIGNKSDLKDRRAVAEDEALALAERCNATYFETSAKTDAGVDPAFRHLCALTVNSRVGKEAQKEPPNRFKVERSYFQDLTPCCKSG